MLRAMLHSASTNYMQVIIMHHFTSLSAGMLAPKTGNDESLFTNQKG